MKLSQLVRYLNYLEDHDGDRVMTESNSLMKYIHDVMWYVDTNDLQFPGVSTRMELVLSDIKESLGAYDSVIDALKKLIKSNIEIWQPNYFRKSHTLHERLQQTIAQGMFTPNPPTLTEDSAEYIRSRLAWYGNWQQPGMIIHPGKTDWIESMVALDPLYLVDVSYDLLKPCLEKFPPEYRARVRQCILSEKYLMKPGQTYGSTESSDQKIPTGQIGIILAYDYFNHRTLDFMTFLLPKISMWLKPGGSLLFTFNNCDHASAVELVENDSACYTPGHLVMAAAERANFEIKHCYDISESVTWLEIQKPGTLSSQRAGQALARPVAKANRIQ